jgi:hypothetical protein
MSVVAPITHSGKFPCSDLYHMVNAPCHLCGDIMKPLCVERHRCNNTVVPQFPKVFKGQDDRQRKPFTQGDGQRKPFTQDDRQRKLFTQDDRQRKPFTQDNKQRFVKSNKSLIVCRYGNTCLSVGCATHCKLPSFVPVKGSENCNKGERCPAVVGCHFSHNTISAPVNSDVSAQVNSSD